MNEELSIGDGIDKERLIDHLRSVVGDASNIIVGHCNAASYILGEPTGNSVRGQFELLERWDLCEHFYDYVFQQTCSAHVNHHEALKEPARVFDGHIDKINEKLRILKETLRREPIPSDDALLFGMLQRIDIQDILLTIETEALALDHYANSWQPVFTNNPSSE